MEPSAPLDTATRPSIPSPATPSVVTPTQPSTPPASARIDSKPMWQLQLAALANPDVARREQTRLEKNLGAGTVNIVVENGLSKLRWGAFASREAADAARSDLKPFRLEGFPVRTSP